MSEGIPLAPCQFWSRGGGSFAVRTSAYEFRNADEPGQTFTWNYDADGRLVEESLSTRDGLTPYDDTFTYDLNGNRMEEIINGGAGNVNGSGATINYTYNGDDERLTEDRTGTFASDITNTYDANGSLTQSVQTGSDAQTDQYTWDLRNRMTQAAVTENGATTTTNYTYDSNGDRTSEEVIPPPGQGQASTTYYLNDTENPTGYTKAVEETSTLGGVPDRSYVLGLRVEGQSTTTSSGTQDVEYLLIDGHGSTRALVNMSGTTTATYDYDYDAFGDALDFDPDTAATPWLFGGDGLYDPSTGFTYQLARWRDGDVFTSFDSIGIDPGETANANLFLYGHGNPISNIDPSGHDGVADVLATVGLISSFIAESLPTLTTAIGYTSLTFLGAAAASSPLAYLEQERYINTGTFFRDLQNGSWARFQLSSFLYVLSADLAQSIAPPAASPLVGQIPMVVANRAGHTDAVNDFIAQAEANGFTVVGTEVSVNTPFGDRDIDVVIEDATGVNHGVEIKSSAGAFNRNDAAARQQFAADRWINENGAQALGQNARIGQIESTSKILWQP